MQQQQIISVISPNAVFLLRIDGVDVEPASIDRPRQDFYDVAKLSQKLPLLPEYLQKENKTATAARNPDWK